MPPSEREPAVLTAWQQPAARTYTVQPGDTLSSIAAELLGSASDWLELYQENEAVIGGNPGMIEPGEVLTIGAGTQSQSSAITGDFSISELESLWEEAGGPSWAAPEMAVIAEQCESGGNPDAYNPDGASGLWQILGLPFSGNPFSPLVNAEMAVAKFRAAGDSYAPWDGDGCV